MLFGIIAGVIPFPTYTYNIKGTILTIWSTHHPHPGPLLSLYKSDSSRYLISVEPYSYKGYIFKSIYFYLEFINKSSFIKYRLTKLCIWLKKSSKKQKFKTFGMFN